MLLRHTGECERWKCLEGCVHPGWIEHDVNILYKNKPKKCCKHVNIKMNLSDVCLNHMSWCFVTFGLSPGEQSKGWVAKSSKQEVWGARRKEMGMASGGVARMPGHSDTDTESILVKEKQGNKMSFSPFPTSKHAFCFMCCCCSFELSVV